MKRDFKEWLKTFRNSICDYGYYVDFNKVYGNVETIKVELNILNSPLFLITFANGMGFNFLVLHGYFKSLPWDYVEASFIDGGNHFNTFFKIMLPQAKGVITALYVVSFIGVWNDYSGPILFLEKYPTLASGIYIYDTTIFHDGNGDIPMLFAGVIMSVIPILALFIAFQEKIMNISIGGGLKG